MPEHKPRFTIAKAAAAALALAVVAAVSRPRRAMQRSEARSPVEPELDEAHLRGLAGEPFFRLVRAYYESRNFHLHHAARHGAGRDADLYFGTLPHAVAVLRVLAEENGEADAALLEDLPELMRRRGVPHAIVHHTGSFTRAAEGFARARHIRLVPVDAFARSAASLPLASRLALCAALANAGGATHPQAELEL